LKLQKWFLVHGYDIIRTGDKGGFVTLVRHRVKYISLASPQNIECQVVEISMTNRKLTIVNVYVTPTTFRHSFCHNTIIPR